MTFKTLVSRFINNYPLPPKKKKHFLLKKWAKTYCFRIVCSLSPRFYCSFFHYLNDPNKNWGLVQKKQRKRVSVFFCCKTCRNCFHKNFQKFSAHVLHRKLRLPGKLWNFFSCVQIVMLGYTNYTTYMWVKLILIYSKFLSFIPLFLIELI